MSHPPGASREAEEAAGLAGLLQPQGGLFGSVARIATLGAEPRLTTRIVRLGDLAYHKATADSIAFGW